MPNLPMPSKWAYAAVFDGKILEDNCPGVESDAGVRVYFYKNWLYVDDEAAWTDCAGFREPTVMKIDHGELRYKDVFVVVHRGPQDGCFAFVRFEKGDKSGSKGEPIGCMVGCGVDGTIDTIVNDWIGVSKESVERIRSEMLNWGGDEHFAKIR